MARMIIRCWNTNLTNYTRGLTKSATANQCFQKEGQDQCLFCVKEKKSNEKGERLTLKSLCPSSVFPCEYWAGFIKFNLILLWQQFYRLRSYSRRYSICSCSSTLMSQRMTFRSHSFQCQWDYECRCTYTSTHTYPPRFMNDYRVSIFTMTPRHASFSRRSLWHKAYSAVRGLMNEMDQWTENKNLYWKKKR